MTGGAPEPQEVGHHRRMALDGHYRREVTPAQRAEFRRQVWATCWGVFWGLVAFAIVCGVVLAILARNHVGGL